MHPARLWSRSWQTSGPRLSLTKAACCPYLLIGKERTVLCHSIKTGTIGERAVLWDHAELVALAKKRGALLCGVQTTLSVIEGHWKLPILFRLLDGTRR